MADKTKILSLYKSLMKESKRIPSYNFREYFLRRTRDAFKDNKSLSDNKAIERQLAYAKDNLQIMKRQAIIGEMYKTNKLVIEK